MFSLSNLASALGVEQEDVETEDEEEVEETEEEENEESRGEPVAVSLWSGISAITSNVTKTVKQRTAEIAASVRETDWKSELTALEQGFREDATEVSRHAKAATETVAQKAKTAAEKAAQNLPGVVEHIPEQAGNLLQNSAKGAQQHLQQATRSISTLGGRVVVGASDLFDNISHAIQNEMALQEGSHGLQKKGSSGAATSGVKYSRFEADVAAMQRDSSTYCDEPEDTENFEEFLATFDVASNKSNIDKLLAENTFMSELQSRIVPLIVEYDDFWTRYFYRLHKLEQKHEQFVQLTQRVEQEDTEEVGWGSDEDIIDAGEQETTAEVVAEDNVEETVQEDQHVDDKTIQPEEEQKPEKEETSPASKIVEESKHDDSVDATQSIEQHAQGEDTTVTASTASDVSESSSGGVKEPWLVVKEKEVSVEAAPATTSTVDAKDANSSQVKSSSTSKEEKKKNKEEVSNVAAPVEVDEDEDAFADVESDVLGGGAGDDDLDEDWGDDVAEWE